MSGSSVDPSSTESLACQELVELVTDFLEGELSPDRLRAFQAHISGCGHCTEYLHQMRLTIEYERLTGAADAPGRPSAADRPEPLAELLAEFRARYPR